MRKFLRPTNSKWLSIILLLTGLYILCSVYCKRKVDTLPANNGKMDAGQKTPTTYFWINDEIKYTYPNEKVVVIQNSGPYGQRGATDAGGRVFTDARGIFFGYRVYSTRIINEAATPLELTITFPSDSFHLPEPDAYMKVFLLPDTIAHDYSASPDYDARLKSYYEVVHHKLPKLQRTIQPKEAYLIYIIVLRHHNRGAPPLGGFFLKEQKLFYKIAPEFEKLIPCGKIVFKK